MKRSKWRARLDGGACDPLLRSWLTEPDSLTARCQRACTDFRVRLLNFGKGRALADESVSKSVGNSAASEAGRGLAWVREVVLECDGRPVIFAHTTLATATPGRLSRWMAGLGNRSLGSLLFSYPGFERGTIEFLRLDARHLLYRRAAALGEVGANLWARRSLHRLGRQQVLVTEVFLPAIRACK
jgi:chorismate--pyruvate lyase